MSAYYNEIDPYAAQWLRNLIAAGQIAPGDVDERSIEDVRPDDLRRYTQCHFFAGVGIWSLGLRGAGWCDTRPVWTGSCPCQPFSAAGKGKGLADERHLFPAWYHLIGECRPPVVFGEQVASKDGLAWLDIVQADLEDAGYACGAVDSCAAGFGAPHIRQRQYFAAYDLGSATGGLQHAPRDGRKQRWAEPGRRSAASGCSADGLEHSIGAGLEEHGGHGDGSCEPGRIDAHAHGSVAEAGIAGGLDNHERKRRAARGRDNGPNDGQQPRSNGPVVRMADANGGERDGRTEATGGHFGNGKDAIRVEGHGGAASSGPSVRMADAHGRNTSAKREQCCGEQRQQQENSASGFVGRIERPGPVNGVWRDADWLFGRDGKWRPVEPGTFPLAHGYPQRVGRLRAYGNAISAPQATEFIMATDAGIALGHIRMSSEGVFG